MVTQSQPNRAKPARGRRLQHQGKAESRKRTKRKRANKQRQEAPTVKLTPQQRQRLQQVKRIKALQRQGMTSTEIQCEHPEFGSQPTIAKAMRYPLWYFERNADDPDRIDCIPGDEITERPRTNEEWMMLIEGILGGTKVRGTWTWEQPWPFTDGTLTRLIRYAERKSLKAWVKLYENYGDVRPSANGGW